MAVSPSYDYDVIVIGAGIGGLVCAARLAQQGIHVVVLEQHSQAGGYCTTFQRGGFTFDAAVHLIGACSPGGIIGNILAQLGLEQEVEFVRVDPIYRLLAPNHDLRLPGELREHLAALAAQFPSERDGLSRLATLIENAWSEIASLLEAPAERTLSLALSSPHLIEIMPLTYRDILDDCLTSPELKAILSFLCTYGGLPAERMSGMYMVSILGSYLAQGAYYPRGGSQSLTNALVTGIVRAGGEVRLNSDVRKVILSDRTVCGVRLDNGEELSAARIVSNADATHTFHELIGKEQLDRRLAHQLQRLELSMSAFQVFLGVNLDIYAAGITDHEVIVTPSYEPGRLYETVPRGDWSEVAFGLCVPSLSDPTLVQPGTHCISLSLPVPAGTRLDWMARKDALVDALVSHAEHVLPGLKQSIAVCEIATPETLGRYTRNRDGACYGWAQTPEQVGTRRLRARTPFKGLFLTGHWTMPGGGIVAVANSGMKTAEIVARSLEVT